MMMEDSTLLVAEAEAEAAAVVVIFDVCVVVGGAKKATFPETTWCIHIDPQRPILVLSHRSIAFAVL